MKKNYIFSLLMVVATVFSANAQTDLATISGQANNPVFNPNPNRPIPSCGYSQPGNALENGRISQPGGGASADDIVIPAGDCWTINTVTFAQFVTGGSTPTQADIYFMDDAAGNPGAVSNGGTAQAISCPFTFTLKGSNFGYDVYEIVCTLPTPITLCAGGTPTSFWLSCQASDAVAGTTFWEFQTVTPYNLSGRYSGSGIGGPWTTNADHFVFALNAQNVVTNQNITVCAGGSVTVGTSTYTTTGNYTDVLTSACLTDSTVNTNLTVLAAKTGTVNNTICDNGSVIVNGTTYNAGNPTGTEVFTNVGPFNCDSTVTINLNVLATKTGSVTTTICNEGSVVVNGTTYNAGNPSGTEVFTNVGPFNCDSTVTVNLNVLPALTGSVTTTICNEGSVVVNGTTYNAGNPTGTEVFTNIGPNNCDSTVTVNLNVLPALTGSVTTTICSEGSVVVNGTTYNAGNPTGTEVFTNIGPNNCDSTVTVNLNVLAALTGTVNTTICNEDSVIVNGTTYNAGNPTGTEVFTNVGPFNCDSTVTVNLNVLAPKGGVASPTICNNDTVMINGTAYHAGNMAGTEVFTNVGPFNCDSTVSVNIILLPALTGTVNSTICNNDSVVVNGTTYNAANPTGTEVFANVGPNNCDSTVTISLNVLPALSGTVNNTICNNDSIVVNGTTYNAANPTGTEVFTNVGPNNCDSTVTINLTVLAAIDITVTNSSPTLTSNETGASYQWLDCDNNFAPLAGETNQNFTATANGNYAVEVTVGSCVDTSACENVNNVGIAERAFGDNFKVYPNPTEDMINIDLGQLNENTFIQLFTIEGKLVHEIVNTTSQVVSIDMSLFNNGLYILKVNNGQEQSVHQIIKR